MNPNHKPIKTEGQYNMVASRIEQLKDVLPQSAGAQELKLLTHLVVAFEKGKPHSNTR